jgi:hypothetical protein
MSPYRRMVLGYAMSRDRISWRTALTLARSVRRYEQLDHEERPRFVAPFRRFCWPAFFWAVLRGSVDQPYTYSIGAFLAFLAYLAVCVQAAVYVGSAASRFVR